jgi:anti-sigma factor ChrR (cupin superfamily)
MHINADFSKRAVVHADRLAWAASPMPGVERRMLDRIGEEVARATSLVRYAPESAFSPHTHGGGEEFLVIEGVFQDEHGDYPTGTYVRNPPTSRHTPGSKEGCVILVKLHQFDPEDRQRVRIDTNTVRREPAAGRPEVAVLPLHKDAREEVRLERWAPGATIELAAPGGLELFVLEGGFSECGEVFARHSWLRLPTGSTLRASAGDAGAEVWLKTGHLAHETR